MFVTESPGNKGLCGKVFAKILLGRAIIILDAQMVTKSNVFSNVKFIPCVTFTG